MPKYRTSLEDLFAKKEAEIQEKVVEYASHNGVTCHKLNVIKYYGKTGMPDYILVHKDLRAFYIEFKVPGGTTERHQLRRHEQLEAKGFKVVIVASIVYGKYWIDKWLAGDVYPKLGRPK